MDNIPNFIRCPSCTSGQIHELGPAIQPIVICAACHTAFCFVHRLLVYESGNPHENMTCAKYDSYLADPLHFRSAHQRGQDAALRERHEARCMARARERVQRLLAASGARERREAAAREDRGRRARARREQARFDEQRRRAAAERRRRANELARQRAEDAQSEMAVTRTTKACPRCRIRIEKNEGCMHMTCECTQCLVRAGGGGL